MSQWLIRTIKHQIFGPYPKSDLIKMVQEGRLHLEDEICPANGYWIYLHEKTEMLRCLGVAYPVSDRFVQEDEDITEVQELPSLIEDRTDTELERPVLFEKKTSLAQTEQPSFWKGLVLFLGLFVLCIGVVIVRLLR